MNANKMTEEQAIKTVKEISEKVFLGIDHNGGLALYTELIDFLQMAKVCHSDYYGVRLWHIASGSTPRDETVQRLDFTEPEWSILDFVKKIEKRLQ